MHKFFKSSLLLVAALAPIILALQPAYVDAQTQNAPSPRRTQHETQKETDEHLDGRPRWRPSAGERLDLRQTVTG
jgi:hypothetical protein